LRFRLSVTHARQRRKLKLAHAEMRELRKISADRLRGESEAVRSSNRSWARAEAAESQLADYKRRHGELRAQLELDCDIADHVYRPLATSVVRAALDADKGEQE
jgi:hypothetical protein